MADHGPKYPIEEGLLPDMTCGAARFDDEDYTGSKKFRPQYFTAKIKNNILQELRLWGPQVLKDGTLGERELDYRRRFDS